MLALATVAICIAALACDADDPDPSPGSGVVVTPSASPGPAASPTPAGRVDGTVAPEGFGGTDPVTIKANPDPLPGGALLRAVRLGVHPEEGGWDRIVFEFAGDLPPGSVSYVPSVAGCGSGMPISLKGSALLVVRFNQSAAHTDAGQPTVARTSLAGPGPAILEARQTCDFEGEVSWALGLAARQRFKVTLLANPTRVVVDVKQ